MIVAAAADVVRRLLISGNEYLHLPATQLSTPIPRHRRHTDLSLAIIGNGPLFVVRIEGPELGAVEDVGTTPNREALAHADTTVVRLTLGWTFHHFGSYGPFFKFLEPHPSISCFMTSFFKPSNVDKNTTDDSTMSVQ